MSEKSNLTPDQIERLRKETVGNKPLQPGETLLGRLIGLNPLSRPIEPNKKTAKAIVNDWADSENKKTNLIYQNQHENEHLKKELQQVKAELGSFRGNRKNAWALGVSADGVIKRLVADGYLVDRETVWRATEKLTNYAVVDIIFHAEGAFYSYVTAFFETKDGKAIGKIQIDNFKRVAEKYSQKNLIDGYFLEYTTAI